MGLHQDSSISAPTTSSKNSGSPNKTPSHATRTPSSASDTTPAPEMLSLQSPSTAQSRLNRATILTSTESMRMPLDHSRASGLPEKLSSSSTLVSGSTLSPSHPPASNSSGPVSTIYANPIFYF